jgi:type I restriction-modification system DNA methylase subunit
MRMPTTTNNLDSPTELLRTAYSQLAFDQGALLPAVRLPQPGALGDWLDRGDWQSLAAQVGAETIFFVDRDPVVVFAKSDDSSPEVLRKLYERIWCMSRPQLLFLATPGQLVVYDLTKAPPKPDERLDEHNRLIAVARSMTEVQSKLAAYHRELIETGTAFGEDRFRDSENRADRALIRDLKTVRQQLAAIPALSGQKRAELHHLHSLIGRAIFVRYLEDRDILIPEYFENVAARRQTWQKLLAQTPSAPALEPGMAKLRFLRVLQNKDFTYALFEQLADDFNGDTFPIEDGERECIQQEHLDKLRGFLMGSTSAQQELFFFAYRFNVIPIELISTIYEEFYNERTGKDRNQGSHYTPPALVEFVLAHTLTPEVLATKPRVLDPACGSGIFLVESFRRIVRHLWAEQNGRRVSRAQLRKILREQIAGIDINEEAVRVAAFSLYLAFLHYQEPREINAARRLPHLKWVSEEERNRREKKKPGAEFFDVLLHLNAFDAISGIGPAEVTRRFGPGSAAVVVGNPPWGYSKKEDEDGQKALAQTLKWCDAEKGRPVGDKELSQAFIHLTLALLRDGGRAGLLVSSGVFFKHHANSRNFREVWLGSARLEHVVNFAHVRQIFFSGPQREAQGISPFVSVVFKRTMDGPPPDSAFQYWSAKRTATIENTKCVVLNRGDMHWLSQRDCLADERLWKIYWWGGYRDEVLVRHLEQFPSVISLPKSLSGVEVTTGQGFAEARKKKRTFSWLQKYKEFPARCLTNYGAFDLSQLKPIPREVKESGRHEVYEGTRLLVRRGIVDKGIASRLVTWPCAFRNSINAVKFKGLNKAQKLTIQGIFWSSLARYFLFLTAGSWGLWHDEIHKENVEEMPLCFPKDINLRDRIVRVVEELQSLELKPEELELAGMAARRRLPNLKKELNDAIFDLYGLSVAERDLVQEMCSLGLDLFYRHQNSEAVQEVVRPEHSTGVLADLGQTDDQLTTYLRTFLDIWNAELSPDGEFAWHVLSPPSNAPLLAVCFSTRYKKGQRSVESTDHDPVAWSDILSDLQQHSLVPAGTSRIFIDTFFRYVSDREILFVKRNERRFWTRTASREDAESALTYLMNQEKGVPGDAQ